MTYWPNILVFLPWKDLDKPYFHKLYDRETSPGMGIQNYSWIISLKLSLVVHLNQVWWRKVTDLSMFYISPWKSGNNSFFMGFFIFQFLSADLSNYLILYLQRISSFHLMPFWTFRLWNHGITLKRYWSRQRCLMCISTLKLWSQRIFESINVQISAQ